MEVRAAATHLSAAPSAPALHAPPSDPLPQDAYAAAVIPRWFLPGPAAERPDFTPHWYTPSVDPLFRRRLNTPPSRRPAPTDQTADTREPVRSTQPRAETPALARAEPSHPAGLLRDFALIAPHLEGVASWYGPGFHGKATSSGEIYDQHRMTAAHPNLPMGTIIRVENQENGRVVWVRVNDRGPYAKGRVLDLSLAAAQRLEMVQEGTAPVRIDVLRWPSTTDTELGLRAYTQYVVQVAAYPESDKAEALLSQLQSRFDWATFLIDGRPGGVLSVIAGPYDDNAQAQVTARRLQQAGITSLVRRYRK